MIFNEQWDKIWQVIHQNCGPQTNFNNKVYSFDYIQLKEVNLKRNNFDIWERGGCVVQSSLHAREVHGLNPALGFSFSKEGI